MLCSFCNSFLIPRQNIRISERPYHTSASLVRLLAAERPEKERENTTWSTIMVFTVFQIQQQLLTTTSGANKRLLSGCCLPTAAEAQSSRKIPLASWPSVRETFFTHYVLMPSLRYLCILVKQSMACRCSAECGPVDDHRRVQRGLVTLAGTGGTVNTGGK